MEQIALALALAGFAGLVKYLQKFTGPKEARPPWDTGEAAICILTGAFVGLLTLWLVSKRIEDTSYVYVAIAIAGYGGPVTLDFFLQAGRDILSRAAQGGKNDPPKG